MCQQALMTLMISIDLLIALIFPVWYRTLPRIQYIFVSVVLCTSYALPISVWGWMARDDEVIPFCNPPLGLAPSASRVLIISSNTISCLVIIVYTAIIVFVKTQGKSVSCRSNRQIIRRLSVILLIFICSWFASTVGMNVLRVFDFSKQTVSLCQSHFVFFSLICYSQTFYVCIWRSTEYRSAFKEQLRIMFCRKSQPYTNAVGIQNPPLFTVSSNSRSRSLH
ncbi:hypothetical protein V3C99_009722 [Haemonchus contortus]